MAAIFNILLVVHFFFSMTLSIPIAEKFSSNWCNNLFYCYNPHESGYCRLLQYYAIDVKDMINNYLEMTHTLTFINIVRRRAILVHMRTNALNNYKLVYSPLFEPILN